MSSLDDISFTETNFTLESTKTSNKNVYAQCMTLIIGIAITIGCITLLVYDIIALKRDSAQDIHDECEGSGLWYFVLINVILFVVQIIIVQKDENKTGSLTLSIVMLTWGSIELWNVDCISNIDDTLLYTVATIHVIGSYITFGVLIIGLIFTWLFNSSN